MTMNNETAVLPKPGSKTKNILKLLLKILVTAVCLFYVSRKVDLEKTSVILKSVNMLWLLLALISFIVSKMLASVRLNIYFRNIDIRLPELKNLKLYWLGMFYNLFLPGSIGGDAYKVIRLTREYKQPYRLTTSAVLLDRISGLAALCFFAALSWVVVFKGGYYSTLVMTGAVVGIPVYYFVVKKWFAKFLPGFWSTLGWGFAVQFLQVACMWCILQALSITAGTNEYVLIFLISSVFAVLPFTIGGLGAREVIFVWGASLFVLDNTISVTASLLFYIVTVGASLFGLPFIFIDPLPPNENTGDAVSTVK